MLPSTATAIPHITSDFKTVDDIGWYGSAYLLTQMACQPVFGRVYVYFEPKVIYLTFLLVFEIGSIVCATAPVSIALIIGRAIAGCGAAGMLTGSLAIFARRSPPRRRPRGMAIMAGISSLAMMLGSTVGGVITDSSLTWRFCFWINLRE
jgi:MFS family permease